MAHKVQAFATHGPKIKPTTPMEADEFIEQLVVSTNQSRGSLVAILAEIEAICEIALKSGRMVKLPNGMRLRPVMKRDGTIEISVRVSSRLTRRVNGGFRGQVLNAENIGKCDGDLFKIWDEHHPDNPINL